MEPDVHARTAGRVRDVVRASVPGLAIHSVVLIGEGTDNLAYEVNGDLVVRFSKEHDPTRRADLTSAEVKLLAAIAQISTLPVPQPLFTDPQQGCRAYAKVPGVPLLDVPLPRRLVLTPAVAAVLGEFLAALHATPIRQMAHLVGRDETPLPECAVEAFLDTAPPPRGGPLAFSHNDLGIEHILINPSSGEITGIIDWSDAALTDRAYDFGLLYRDLGPAALDIALNTYQAHDATALRQRAVFYARCTLLEDLAYGIQSDLSAYTDKSLTALEWLFPG